MWYFFSVDGKLCWLIEIKGIAQMKNNKSEMFSVHVLSAFITLKNSIVEPDISVPYWTSVWYARSLADLIGVTIRSTVKNAAKFAV